MKRRHLYYLAVSLLSIVYLLVKYVDFSALLPPSKVEKTVAAGRSLADIVRTLQAYGLKPTVVSRTPYGPDSIGRFSVSSWWPGAEQDVIATMPGTNSQGRILVYAQYKRTFPRADGVSGDASSSLLELIDALQKRPRLQNDVTFFFSTAERAATPEGESLEESFSLARESDVLLEIEHRDKGGEVLLFFASKYNYHLVEKYAQAAALDGAGRREALPSRANALAFVEYLGNKSLTRPAEQASLMAPFISTPQTGTYEPGLRVIDAAIEAFLHKWKIPGGAVAIAKDGRLVYNRGFGFAHRQAHTPVQPTHQFRIASLSKPITSAAILLLLEQGRLRLDSRVFGSGGILSDSSYGAITDQRVKQITVRHLLEHSAGWDRDVSKDVMFDPVKIARIMQVHPPADNKSIIRFALSRPLDFSPGTRYVYSNVGYAVLGRIIEKLSGVPYETFVQTHLLAPLGIRTMRIGNTLPGNSPGEEVEYYPTAFSKLVPSVFGNNIWVPWAYGGFYLEAMDAHGGWIASASDLVRFVVAVDGFATKPDILSPATLQLMATPTPALKSGYGLGWWVNAKGSWCHTGVLPGSSSLLERTRDGYTWAILLNRRSTHNDYFRELNALIRDNIKQVKEWPTYDLFGVPVASAPAAIEGPDTSFYTPLLADTATGR